MKLLISVLFSLLPITTFVSTKGFAAGERHFLVVFGSQDSSGAAVKSHSWGTVFTIAEDNSVSESTISWLPSEGYFHKTWSPEVRDYLYTVPPLLAAPGKNYSLDQTLELAKYYHVRYWGPYEVSPNFYQAFEQRRANLESGAYSYKMIANGRIRHTINCIHALAGVTSNVGTGIQRGFSASSTVLQSFSPYLTEPGFQVNEFAARRLDITKRIRLNR